MTETTTLQQLVQMDTNRQILLVCMWLNMLMKAVEFVHCVFDSDDEMKESDVPSSYVWLRPNLRVRIVDENYRRGKYYNLKVKCFL